MNRRGFIGSILAIGAAPAIVKASSLMRVQGIIVPTLEEVLAVNSGRPILEINMITRRALEALEENLVMSRSIESKWADFVKSNTVVIRRPITYAR